MVALPQNPIIVMFGGNAMTMKDGLNIALSSGINEFFGNKYDLFLMDYPCSGMSHNASQTMENTMNSAYNLYTKALELSNHDNNTREIWVMTISIGMAVFASILSRIPDNDQPNGIICINGLMSMRKTVIKTTHHFGRIYHYGLGGDLNTARLISQYLLPRVRLYWFQGDQDELIDVPNVKKVFNKWRSQERELNVYLIMLRGYSHNNFSVHGILTRLINLNPQPNEFIFKR